MLKQDRYILELKKDIVEDNQNTKFWSIPITLTQDQAIDIFLKLHIDFTKEDILEAKILKDYRTEKIDREAFLKGYYGKESPASPT